MPQISKRASKIPTSSVRVLAQYADEVKANNINILPLNIGAPDLAVDNAYFDAIKQYDTNLLPYENSQGYQPLINEVIKYYANINVPLLNNDIYVCNGGSEALLFAMLSTCDSDDHILVFEPFYSNYETLAKSCEVNIDVVETYPEDGYHLPNKESILKKIHPKTKAILLSNPCNPSGVAFSSEEVDLIAEIAYENKLFVIADEVYREYIYDGYETKSFGSVSLISEQVIIIDSVSKRFSACGARVGFLITRNELIQEAALKLCQSRLSISNIEQHGVCALYQKAMHYMKECNIEYKNRRDLILKLLNDIPGISVKVPEGAFYVLASLPVSDAQAFSIWLLTKFNIDNETIMLTPASGFYKTEGRGVNQVRIAYVINEEKIVRAMNILKEGLNLYNNNEA